MPDLIPLASEPEDYEYPKPGKSTILFQLIEEPTYQWTRWDSKAQRHVEVGLSIYECQYEGGSAEMEVEQGMLNDSIYGMLDHNVHTKGWWVMEGFYGRFIKGDGWTTDDDMDFECDDIRRATWQDMEHFGISRTPMFCKLLMLFGFKVMVANDYEAYVE